MNYKIIDKEKDYNLIRGSEYSAGIDLRNVEDAVVIQPNQKYVIHTNVAVEIPCGYMGLILSRSGLSSKKELVLLNGVGLIDNDYRGEIMVAVKNLSDKDITLEKFEMVAQLVITPYLHVPLNKVDELSDTERGTGGFGSSGRK